MLIPTFEYGSYGGLLELFRKVPSFDRGIEERRNRRRMSAFLTSYAHAFCTVTWLWPRASRTKKQKAKKSSLSWVISVSKICNSIREFTIPLEYVSLWEGFSEHCGCHLFVRSWSECLSDQRFAAKLCARWAAKRRLISNVRHGVNSL